MKIVKIMLCSALLAQSPTLQASEQRKKTSWWKPIATLAIVCGAFALSNPCLLHVSCPALPPADKMPDASQTPTPLAHIIFALPDQELHFSNTALLPPLSCPEEKKKGRAQTQSKTLIVFQPRCIPCEHP